MIMIYKKLNFVEFPDWYKNYVKSPYQTNISLMMDKDKRIIGIGEASELPNLNNISSDFIPVNINHCGGTIVGFPNSITLFTFTNVENDPKIEEKLVNYLKSKNLNAYIDKNDVMIDEFKIAGGMSKWISKDIQFFGIHISIEIDVDKISKICTKSMIKIPKGLSEYNITKEEILTALNIEEE